MAYAVGHISGGHFNPAVTIGLAVAKRFAWKDALPYIVTQVVAGTAAATVLFVIANGKAGFSAHDSGFASNGYGDRSPDGYNLLSALLIEIVLTAIFVYVILGATDGRAPVGFAPIAIGFALTLIHLVSIPVDNTSVNPARSTAVAFFAGGPALAQLWLFWVAPIVGALIAGATYHGITGEKNAAELAGERRETPDIQDA
jgi:aquaporin Z